MGTLSEEQIQRLLEASDKAANRIWLESQLNPYPTITRVDEPMKYDTWPALENPYAPTKTENVKKSEQSGYEFCMPSGCGVNLGYPSDDATALQQRATGYPTDDAMSLQQMAGTGTANLDIYYNNSFVQNETHTHQGGSANLSFVIEHTPILEGTMTGTIYDGESAIQTFVVSQAGHATLANIGPPRMVHVTGINLNVLTGVINFQWNQDPGPNSIVVSYEYNIEPQYNDYQYNTGGKMSATATATWSKPKSAWEKLEAGEIAPEESVVGHVTNDEVAELQRQLAEARNELSVTKRVLENLEVELYNEYDQKVKQVKEFVVDQVDKFLTHKSQTWEGTQECVKMGGKQIVEDAIRYRAEMDESKELRQQWEQKG